MALALVQAICLDSNVVAGLSAVTDADLQTATETAANDLIGVPVSYTDLITLATDATFLRRVQIAVAHFANYCLNEAPNTANHPARYCLGAELHPQYTGSRQRAGAGGRDGCDRGREPVGNNGRTVAVRGGI